MCNQSCYLELKHCDRMIVTIPLLRTERVYAKTEKAVCKVKAEG